MNHRRQSIQLVSQVFGCLEPGLRCVNFQPRRSGAGTAGKWPLLEDVTASFTYIRLHGDEELYVSGYTPKALNRWAERIRLWSTGRQPGDASLATPHAARATPPTRDVYCYFDNDVKVRAPVDAAKLMKKPGISFAAAANRRRPTLFSPPASDLAAFTAAQLAPRWKFKKSLRPVS